MNQNAATKYGVESRNSHPELVPYIQWLKRGLPMQVLPSSSAALASSNWNQMLQGLSAWNVSPIYKMAAFLLRFSGRLAVPRFIEGLCTSLSPVHVIPTRFLRRANSISVTDLHLPALLSVARTDAADAADATDAGDYLGAGSAMRRHVRATAYSLHP